MTPMPAALHLVPDPDDEPTPPPDTAGEQHPTQAAPAAEEPGEQHPGDVDEPGEEDAPDEDGELGDDEDEEPAPRRALAMPDLRPYYDPSWIPAVINAGAEGTRRWRQRAPERKAARRAAKAKAAAQAAGEPVGRARLAAMATDYLAGTRLLLGHLYAWLSGEYGPKDLKVPARLAAVGLAGYCTVRTVMAWPVWGPVGIVTVWCCAALGALHRQRAEQAKKQPAPAAAKGVAKVPGPAPARGAAQAITEGAVDVVEEGPAEAAEEAPPEPPLTALIRAQIGTENGVHLADLRPAMRAAFPALAGATDEELREVLEQAGWDPSKKFRARGRAGRQGVHRKQLPPLPSPGGGPGHSPQGRDRPRPANSSRAESGGERAESGEDRGVDIIPDPDRGPSAWKVVPRR
ncbi:hypothetical protein ACFY8S_01725 [Streptomyces hygroscopicus]|uniref:hypothetical protein n=1 Tax=Streptomyces hygroscopicus TaxID=1912 RepID=UPI00367AC3A7